jgi:hypothetical protein
LRLSDHAEQATIHVFDAFHENLTRKMNRVTIVHNAFSRKGI